MFILILLSLVSGGYSVATVAVPYHTKKACEAAGKEFASGGIRDFQCIKGPSYE